MTKIILAITTLMFLQSCVNSGLESLSFKEMSLSSALPLKVQAGDVIPLSYTFTSDSQTTETFLLKAYQNSSCITPALGSLQADANPVGIVNNQATYNNLKYDLAGASSETIYLKVESSAGRFSNCTAGIRILFTPIVLGQPNFTSSVAQSIINATTFAAWEYKIHSDGQRLFIADYPNSRILIWNTIPTTMLQPADVVVGQPDMNSNTCNNGTISARTLCWPGGVFSTGTKLFVADWNNSRVLIWNTIPTTNFAPADVVLGQPNMTSRASNNGGTSPVSLNYPWHLFAAAGKLFVSDYSNGRILIWNTIPTVNRTPADVVVGQPSFASAAGCNAGLPAPTARTVCYPYEVTSDGTRMIIADSSNYRVLIWNTIPTTDYVAADTVIGQPDMISNLPNAGVSANSQTIGYATSVYIHRNKIYVSDGVNARILIYSTIPTSNFAAADLVLGQPDMTTVGANTGGVSKTSLNTYIEGLYVDDSKIIIGDPNNHRVLILNTPD